MKLTIRLALAALAALPSATALACASCGCALGSDWEGPGVATAKGLYFDVRYDMLNQNQVRSGTGVVHGWPVEGHEQELYTRNRYLSATLDYSPNAEWGVTLQLPFIDRTHASNGLEFDGSDAGSARTRALGDVKLMARYMGFSKNGDLGIQFGLKLPTGSYTQPFDAGALAGAPLDRGLQPGSGTTDLVLGLLTFGAAGGEWDYFAQALTQIPLNSRDGYRPGAGFNLNLGLRYTGLGQVVPQVHLNGRIAAKDAGVNASPDDSGGKTLYLSPGLSVSVSEKTKLYGFVQLPLYQNLNGYQLAPRYALSLGARFAF